MSDTPKKCPKCSASVIMVEYHLMDKNHYNGVSEYDCKNALGKSPTCDWRIGRWCGQELGPGEVEPRFHEGTTHPRVFVIEQGAVDEPLKNDEE